MRRGAGGELLSLSDATERLRAFEGAYLGLRAIPLCRVVGSESRLGDFDREFLPLRAGLRPRWQQLEAAFPEGDFPPIVVRQLGDAFFVLDGHHRVAVARQYGMELIDAEVTMLRARWHLSAGADRFELAHAEQEWIFMQESGLVLAEPRAAVRFSRPVGYRQLLEHVQAHGYRLTRERAAALPPHEIAGDWYERSYLPTTESIRRAGVTGVCRHATDADVFLWIEDRRAELLVESPELTLEDVIRSAAREGGRRGRVRAGLADRALGY
jgi:hypothetical protein